MPGPSQRRSKKRTSAPSQEKQARIKLSKRNEDLKHNFADQDTLDAFQTKVASLPELSQCKKISADEMKECVSEACKFMLAQNRVKPMVPVPSAAISKHLKELNVRAVGVSKHVMARARVEFLHWMFDLIEIGSTSPCYLLRSLAPAEFRIQYILSPQEKAMLGVRLIMQMLLHASGGKATADSVRKFLESFQLRVSLKRQHEVSTVDLKKNINRFGTENPVNLLVEQKFLKAAAEEEIDGGTEIVYSLGEAQAGDAAECTDEDMQAHLKDLMDT